MKIINAADPFVLVDIYKTLESLENVLPDSVTCLIFNYYSMESSDPILFISIRDENGSLDSDLAEFINECENVPEHIQTETRAGSGEPVILCEEVGDCKSGFDFLLKNYPHWQKYKLAARAKKRTGKSPKNEAPQAL